MSSILVLGGAGYIGSHTVYELIEAGENVVVVDNLETGFRKAVHPDAKFYQGDIRDRAFIDSVFEKEDILVVKLFHCKFSKGTSAGHRVGDLYEVCGQAVKSVKWKWDAKSLFRHLQSRKNHGLGVERRFFYGSNETLTRLMQKLDYTAPPCFEFWIVQPGLASHNLPDTLSRLLMSCSSTIADMTECQLRCISS